MSAERQSPSAAYVPTQMKERIVIRSEERTSADLRSRSSGVSDGCEPTAAARPTTMFTHSRKLTRRTLGQPPTRISQIHGTSDSLNYTLLVRGWLPLWRLVERHRRTRARGNRDQGGSRRHERSARSAPRLARSRASLGSQRHIDKERRGGALGEATVGETLTAAFALTTLARVVSKRRDPAIARSPQPVARAPPETREPWVAAENLEEHELTAAWSSPPITPTSYTTPWNLTDPSILRRNPEGTRDAYRLPSATRCAHVRTAAAHDLAWLARPLGQDWSAAGECGGKLLSRADLQLAKDAREMSLDRARRHEQCLGDFAVAQALARELGNTALAGSQGIEPAEDDPSRARSGGAELGLGVFGEGHGASAVGGVECLTKQASRLRAPIAPPQHRAEVSERARFLQSDLPALEYLDSLTEQGCPTVTAGHDAGRTQRHAECARRTERAGEPKFLFCEASRRFPIAEPEVDEGSL